MTICVYIYIYICICIIIMHTLMLTTSDYHNAT